jgi:UDP-N-acetylmuramate--alanine ligase
MELENKFLLTRDETMEWLKNNPVDMVLTMGAGDIDRMVEPITEILKNKN